MSNVALESGDGTGFTAKVQSDGSLGAAVTNTVTTRCVQASVVRTEVAVGTTSGLLVAENASRRQIQVQNLSGANAIHIRLGSSGSAGTTDLRIDPGQTYSFPAGAAATDLIQAVAVGASAQAIVVEFNG